MNAIVGSPPSQEVTATLESSQTVERAVERNKSENVGPATGYEMGAYQIGK